MLIEIKPLMPWFIVAFVNNVSSAGFVHNGNATPVVGINSASVETSRDESDPHWLMEAPPQGNEADCNSFVPPFSSLIVGPIGYRPIPGIFLLLLLLLLLGR